jgi:hypothetical protein
MKSGNPRLQHYVPQFLLRRFAAPSGKVCAYDTKLKKMFWSDPRGIAAEGYFYSSAAQNNSKETISLEKWFANYIEPGGAAAIDALLKRETLSPDKIDAFFRFVAAQMQRTPSGLQRANDFAAPVFQETTERIAKHHAEFRENVIREIRASGSTEDDVAQFVKILDEGKFTVTPTREFVLASALNLINLISVELAKMRWIFASVPDADPSLLIGDHPVTLADVRGEGLLAEPLGIKSPHIEIALPLSPRIVALAHWDGPVSYGELAQGTASVLNERSLSHATRFAYASFESVETLEQAVALRGTGPKMRTRRIQIGEKLVIDSQYL